MGDRILTTVNSDEIKMITTMNFVVLNDVKKEFDEVYNFVYDHSSMSTQMNISQAWKIEYVDEITEELTHEISIVDQGDIDRVFEEYIRDRISGMGLIYRIDDEGDIIVNLPFEYSWKEFDNKFHDIVDEISQDFCENSANEFVDLVLLQHAKGSDYQYEDNKILIGCKSINDQIFLEVAEDLAVDHFTTRQVQVLLKRLMEFRLDSTERNILSQIRNKIKKAEGIMSELEYHKDLFALIVIT